MKKSIFALILAFCTTVLLSAGGTAQALSMPSGITNNTMSKMAVATSATEHPCLRATNHEYEVCSAYVGNSSLAVLVPYYKYANSTNASSAGYVSYRLGQRYVGAANTLLTQRVKAFGVGTNNVSVPTIKILSVSSNLPNNTATLVTQESWLVRSKAGTVVYKETSARHVVTMNRVPSYVLHKWVVSDIR